MVHLRFVRKKCEDHSNVEDNQNTIILEETEEMDYLQHFRALANQISF